MMNVQFTGTITLKGLTDDKQSVTLRLEADAVPGAPIAPGESPNPLYVAVAPDRIPAGLDIGTRVKVHGVAFYGNHEWKNPRDGSSKDYTRFRIRGTAVEVLK